MSNLARYYHAALFPPPISTLTEAISRGNLITWPGIEKIPFKSVIETTVALEKGHLDQERSGLQSTTTVMDDKLIDEFPIKEKKVYNVFAIMQPTKKIETFKRKSYSD